MLRSDPRLLLQGRGAAACPARGEDVNCQVAVVSWNDNSDSTGCKGAVNNAATGISKKVCTNIDGNRDGKEWLTDNGRSEKQENCGRWYKRCCTCKRNGDKCEPNKASKNGQDDFGSQNRVGDAQATAKGDPHITNIHGVHFDILALGSFCFLSISNASIFLIKVNAMITRRSNQCDQTFISSADVTGGWIAEAINSTFFKIRAAQDASISEALQIKLHSSWIKAENYFNTSSLNVSSSEVCILSKIKMCVNLNQHWGWNFLEIALSGLEKVDEDLHRGGLLIDDDFTAAAMPPDNCVQPELFRGELRTFVEISLT